jgi:hypothetical protein
MFSSRMSFPSKEGTATTITMILDALLLVRGNEVCLIIDRPKCRSKRANRSNKTLHSNYSVVVVCQKPNHSILTLLVIHFSPPVPVLVFSICTSFSITPFQPPGSNGRHGTAGKTPFSNRDGKRRVIWGIIVVKQ